jgi:hypothetical protein
VAVAHKTFISDKHFTNSARIGPFPITNGLFDGASLAYFSSSPLCLTSADPFGAL